MKILVSVKRVIDHNVRIRVKPDGSGVEQSNVKMSMNPYDENAVEEAVRMREAGGADEVVAVTIGHEKAEDVLRAALAMGADRALLVRVANDVPTDIGGVEPLAVAKILKEIVRRESPELVLMGKQAIDDDSSQVPQMLAGILGWGQGCFASGVELSEDGKGVMVSKEVDGGVEKVFLKLPAVVSADLNLNEPRYASLPNIMKAKKKPLEVVDYDSIGVDISPRLEVLSVGEPVYSRGDVVMVESVDELLDRLRNEAKVI